MDSDEVSGIDNSGNLLPLDPNLHGVVRAELAVCTQQTFENIHKMFDACGHSNDIGKHSVQAICARAYEIFFATNFFLQMRAGATLGVQVRGILECTADVIGFAEDTDYLKKWVCQEKQQWESLLKADVNLPKDTSSNATTSHWKSMSESRIKDIQSFLAKHELSCDNHTSDGVRLKLLEAHTPDLALEYKFLCVDAHNRPTSLFAHHSRDGRVVIFLPTNPNFLEYYAITMLQAWAVIAHAMSKIWVGDHKAVFAMHAIITSINKTLEQISIEA
jgi:hypothetical protein